MISAGPHQFRARVRRRTASGTVTVSETFETRKEASDWAAIQDGKVIGDDYVDRTAIRQMTVRQSCEWWSDRIAPLNRTTGKRQPKTSHAKNQASSLQYWMKSGFADWSLVSLGPWDLIDWRDEILDSGEISAQTVVHRLNALSQVYINISLSMKLELTNPVAQKVRPSLGPGRDRRLDPEPDASGRTEEQRLLAACDAGSRPWLRPEPRSNMTPCSTRQSWPHNLNKRASGKPGAVQTT